MRTVGIIVIVLGIAACAFSMLAGLDAVGEGPAIGSIATAIGAVGIVAAGAVILRNS